MQFLDWEGVQALWNKIKEVFVKKDGDTMTGTLTFGSSSTGETIEINPDEGIKITALRTGIQSQGVIYGEAFYENSDKSLKENINNINNSDLEKVSNLVLKEFNFKEDPEKLKKYGVIAQELEELGLSNLVSVNKATGKKSVDYISLLILKIKELEERIKNLENNKED